MPPKRIQVAKTGFSITKKVKIEKGKNENNRSSESDSDSDGNLENDKKKNTSAMNTCKINNTELKANTSTTSQPHITMKNCKASMAFQKGTFVIRLDDIGKEGLNWMWRVDNHQLLQKYYLDNENSENDGQRQWYKKSNRYTGWFCNEKWKFLEIRVLKREPKDDKVKVLYPKGEMVAIAKEACDAENKRIKLEEEEH